MSDFDYLIVGGGISGFAAAQAIREVDERGSIGMLSEEPEGPYDRTALSKSLWKGGSEADILFDLDEVGVQLVPLRAEKVDTRAHTVVDQAGNGSRYGKLLLATGVRARPLPGDPGVVRYLRSLEDYRRIRRAADSVLSFLVIGGGFLGAELAAALVGKGSPVTMVFPEAGIGSLMFPEDLALHLNGEFQSRGVNVIPGCTVTRLAKVGKGRVEATLSDGQLVVVDEVVAAIGAMADTRLAEAAGIEVADGIVVDEFFRTSAPEIFAAGDLASYPDPVLGRRRVEHEDQAMHSGRHAGLAMAGQGIPYRHLPLFYSDLFDHGYEAVGTLDSKLRTFARWEEPCRKGIIYYLDESSRVRGVLLWNSWGLVDEARELLRAGTSIDPAELEPGAAAGG